MAHEIHKSTVRNRLAPRREPYWGSPIDRGLFVGFRRLEFGGNWIARWRDPDGVQRYQALGPATDQLDYFAAEAKARQWQRVAAAGIDSGEVETVADACRAYVEAKRKLKGDDPADDTDRRFKRLVYDAPIGGKLLSKLRQRDIEAWRDSQASKKTTVNRNLTVLKAALNFAAEHRYVAAERTIEWDNVKAYLADGRRDLFLDVEQRRKMLAQASGAVRDLIEACMLTGARAGELASAKRKQFDERSGSMTFTGKTGTRTVPLAPQAVELFTRLARSKLPEAYLFTRDNGEPWRRFDWGYPVRQAAKGLPAGTCLYTLRHSFITEAITGGLSPLEAARVVGTSLQMIDKHYGHLAQSTARDRLSRINFT